MTWLVAGLGNPGPRYAGTRHNVGFLTLDELVRRLGLAFKPARGMQADIATARLGSAGLLAQGAGEQVVLAKPTTFMNDSGVALRKLADFGKVPLDHVVVVHDELDLDVGRLRLKRGGGDNGHNGLKSIRAHLNSGEFYRVRLGIGRPPVGYAMIDYVLGRFPKAQAAAVTDEIAQAADAVESLLRHGLEVTQNAFNH
jgi:PTH1 family peptidyl-tRNA hydrolase